MEEQGQQPTPDLFAWIGWRIAVRVLILLAFGLGVYAAAQGAGPSSGALTIGWAILVVLPYAIGALTQLLIHVPDTNRSRPSWIGPLITVVTVLGVGALVLREGLICIVILTPIWMCAALFGAVSVTNLHNVFRERHRTSAFVFAMLPFAALLADANLPPPADRFTVSRSIVIDAVAAEIWPHLLQLDGLTPDEGVWNLTQNVLGIPRPSSAVVAGEGVGAIRAARWGGDIRFEERITEWRENARLGWEFAFPDNSISRYTDPHIHPDGANLKIEHGAYSLTTLPGGGTQLTLETIYFARTPVNLYAALWGELVLGDIQSNILAVVKTRATKK